MNREMYHYNKYWLVTESQYDQFDQIPETPNSSRTLLHAISNQLTLESDDINTTTHTDRPSRDKHNRLPAVAKLIKRVIQAKNTR